MTKTKTFRDLFIIMAFAAFFALAVSAHAASGDITTVAANRAVPDSWNGGQPIPARVMSTNGVAIDSTGNIYIADATNHYVRRVATNGDITIFAGKGSPGYTGDGPAASAKLYSPNDVAIDRAGNVYIADSQNHRIRKVGTNGLITTVAGTGTPGYSGDGEAASSARLNYPVDLAVDSEDNIFIADMGNNRIRKIDASGIITTVAGNETGVNSGKGVAATSVRLDYPMSVAVDSSNNIYIADKFNNRVLKVNTKGIMTTVAGNGATAFSGDGGPASSASLFNPTGVAVDSADNIYIADTFNNRIRKVSTTGIITTIAGDGKGTYAGDGGPATSASLYTPYRMAVDSIGNLYIADFSNNRIRKVEGAGVVKAQEAAAGAATINSKAQAAVVVIAPETGAGIGAVSTVSTATAQAAEVVIAQETGAKTIKDMRKAQNRAVLDILKAGTGTGTVYSSPVGIVCGGDCTEAYPLGMLVDLMATPDVGSSFAGWSGNADCNTGIRYIQLTMDADKTCTATFNVTHTLQVTQTGKGSGTVTGEGNYKKGTSVTLTATPDSNSIFIGWSGDEDCKDGKVTVNEDMLCSAAFNIKTYTLKVLNAGIGFGTITGDGINCGADCSEVFDSGTFVALTATSYAGSTFTGWSGNEGCSDGMVTMLESKTCTATFSAPPANSATLSPNRTSPQGVGTHISFSALGSGGSGYYEYEFWLKTGKTWAITQGYSTNNVWTWDTKGAKSAAYSVRVYVRNIGSTAVYEASQSIAYKLNIPPASGLTFYPSVASPQILGTPVTFTSLASGGSGSYEYQFWLKAGADTAWKLKQEYSPNSNWAWDMEEVNPGTYTVMVYARNMGSTAQYQVSKSLSYTLSIPPATGITLLPSLAGAWVVGTPITFTSEASGGIGCYEYQFTLKSGTTSTIAQGYSKSDTWVWDTSKITPGTYFVSVAARSYGSTATYEVLMTKGYAISAQQPTGATLIPSIITQPETGTPVTFTSVASGGSGNYEYQFWLKSGPTPLIMQGYSSSNVWTWDTTNVAAGTYYVIVHVRNAGSTAPYEVLVSKSYTIK